MRPSMAEGAASRAVDGPFARTTALTCGHRMLAHDCRARAVPDGSRVNVVVPPLALDGPVLTIRRFRRRVFTPDELVANGTLTAPLAELLARAVRRRCNLLVCGGTGSGKTTLLNA